MVPDLKTVPVCICPIREAAERFQGALGRRIILSTGLGSAQTWALRLELWRAERDQMRDDNTIIVDSLTGIDYAEIEKRTYALMASKTRLSGEEFYSILRPIVKTPERPEEEYKRKPWLRLQDSYEKQKSRRKGRPKKGR